MLQRIALRAVVALAIAGVLFAILWQRRREERTPIRIGVLVAKTGPSAAFDRVTLDACLAAADVVNAAGGADGHPLSLEVRDTQGSPATAAAEAERLCRDGVTLMVGGNEPVERRAIEKAIEPFGGLLVSTTSSEGLDSSPALVSLGSLPNQRAIPAAAWAVRTIGPRVHVVLEDDLIERVVAETLGDHVYAMGGSVVSETLLDGGAASMDAVLDAVNDVRPDVIVSGLGTEASRALVTALRGAGITSDDIPTVHWQLRARAVDAIGKELLAGDYLVSSTFSAEEAMGDDVVAAYAKRAGGARPDAQAVIAASAVELLANAIARAGDADPQAVKAAIGLTQLPLGDSVLCVDPRTQAAWKVVRVVRVTEGGDVEDAWVSDGLVRPDPWPSWRSHPEWERFLTEAVQ